VTDTNGELLGKQGETIELTSSNKLESKRTAAILMRNGDSALRELGEEPKAKAPKKKKKKASYKTRQATADDTASD